MRHVYSFLSGAALIAAVAYFAGGGMRAGILIGASLVIIATLISARQAARLLLALSDSLDAFRAHWQTAQPPARQLKLTPRKPQTKVDTLTATQHDVKSALIHLGVSGSRAHLAAIQAAGIEDFETAFRKAQKAAA